MGVGNVRTRGTALGLVIPLALLGVACGGDDDTATTTTTVAPDGTTTSEAGDTTTSAPVTEPTIASGGTGVEEIAAEFDRLNDLAVDADGTVWVTEANDSTLLELADTGPVVHYTGDQEGAEPETEMSGLAIDDDGQIWFATRRGVYRLDPETDEAEVVVAAADTDLAGPIYRLAVGGDGELFIGDAGQDKVFRLDGTELVHVAGSGGSPASDAAAEGAAVDMALGDVRDLAVDAAGNLYIADDYGQRVRMVTPDGAITDVAGGGDLDPVLEGEPAPEDTAGDELDLEAPTGVWTIGETVFVADTTLDIVIALDPTTGFEVVLGADEVEGSAERGDGRATDEIYVIISETAVGRIL
jgi:hypothetical protein